MTKLNKIKEFFVLVGAGLLFVPVMFYEKFLAKRYRENICDAGDELE